MRSQGRTGLRDYVSRVEDLIYVRRCSELSLVYESQARESRASQLLLLIQGAEAIFFEETIIQPQEAELEAMRQTLFESRLLHANKRD